MKVEDFKIGDTVRRNEKFMRESNGLFNQTEAVVSALRAEGIDCMVWVDCDGHRELRQIETIEIISRDGVRLGDLVYGYKKIPNAGYDETVVAGNIIKIDGEGFHVECPFGSHEPCAIERAKEFNSDHWMYEEYLDKKDEHDRNIANMLDHGAFAVSGGQVFIKKAFIGGGYVKDMPEGGGCTYSGPLCAVAIKKKTPGELLDELSAALVRYNDAAQDEDLPRFVLAQK